MRMGENGEAFALRLKNNPTGSDSDERALADFGSLHPLPGDLVGPGQTAQREGQPPRAPARFGHLDPLPRLPEGGAGVAQYLVHRRRQRVGVGARLRIPAPPRDLDRPLDHLRAIHGMPEPGRREAATQQIHAVRAEPRDLGTEVRVTPAQGLRLRRDPDRLPQAPGEREVYAVRTPRHEAEE